MNYTKYTIHLLLTATCILMASCAPEMRSISSLDSDNCSTNFIDLVYQANYYNELDRTNLQTLALKYRELQEKYHIGAEVSENQLSALNDVIITTTYNDLTNQGIKLELSQTPISSNDKRLSKTLTLNLYEDNGRSYISKLGRLMGASSIEFSMLGKTLSRNDGTFNSTTRKVSLHLLNHYEVLKKGKITNTLRHELSHANFAQMRRNGIDSIFSSQYYYATPQKYIYSNYISLEELYNYAADPYWLKRTADEFREDLSLTAVNLYHKDEALIILEDIAFQIKETSAHFLRMLEEGKYAMKLVKEHNSLIVKLENGDMLSRYIIDAEMGKNPNELILKIFREQEKLNRMATQLIDQAQIQGNVTTKLLNQALTLSGNPNPAPQSVERMIQGIRELNISLRKIATHVRPSH